MPFVQAGRGHGGRVEEVALEENQSALGFLEVAPLLHLAGTHPQPGPRFEAHVPGANERIAQLTGVTFGTGYRRVLAEGTVVMDSADAAAGLVALRSQPGANALEAGVAMQRASSPPRPRPPPRSSPWRSC
ncbi:hypothetical protein [Streptomyces sp. NPDC001165]|uniref:hypothetical protein n=1 Tax=Streptomyces sp. NPDC001165 TaxID=3364546 RepID=UPI0036B9AF19